jgi:hypothetical protein
MVVSPMDCERLHTAALLSGLTEAEAERLMALIQADTLQILDAPTFAAIRLQSPGQAPVSLRIWAGQQSHAGTVLVQHEVTQYLAYFASDKATGAEAIAVGVSESPVAALFALAPCYAVAGIASDLDADSLSIALNQAGLIAWQLPFIRCSRYVIGGRRR